MNKLGLKEPGFENRRTFSKKAREPQKLSRFQKFALVSQRFPIMESIQKSLKFASIGNESHVDKHGTKFSKQRARTNYFLAKQLKER